MSRILRPPCLVGSLTLALCAAPGLASGASRYDPLETFASLSLPDAVNGLRAADGAPGSAYWQNRADYAIHARLVPAKRQLSATEIITYTNNSPQSLDCLWLQLDQNIYRKDSRSNYAFDLPHRMSGALHMPVARIRP